MVQNFVKSSIANSSDAKFCVIVKIISISKELKDDVTNTVLSI